MAEQDIALMAHLLRRAGFGASREEIEARAAAGYEATVAEMLNPESTPGLDEDLLMRYQPAYHEAAAIETNVQQWIYYMINNPRQLEEKMALFWHMIFCAGHSKIDSGQEMGLMVKMFRQHGMGNFKDMLVLLSTNPGMIYYLDNCESHKVAVNENYGRELLELFSMGVGRDEEFNYSEDDVKACARAFTGWNIAPAYPPFPYGRSPWQFRFDPADHDESDKTFLGQTGNWNGDDIIEMICQQPATARFISRHLCNYLIGDDVPVPSWRQTPPQHIELIEKLEKTYFDSGYEIKAMLEVLLNSDEFKNARYTKVKNPAEMVVGTLRLVGDHREIKPGLFDISQEPKYMGMDLMNPPTVEGWHTGHEWIDSGTLVERINFAADYMGQTDLPGVRGIIDRLMGQGDSLSPEQFVEGCLDMVGQLAVTEETLDQLVSHAQRGGDLTHGNDAERDEFARRSGEMLQMIAATSEYQFG